MASKLVDTVTSASVSVVNPGTLLKFPEGGATFSVAFEAGGTQTCTVQLRAWNNSMPAAAKEVLWTCVLPVIGGIKNGDLFDSLPVFSIWDDFDWNITALGSGATVRLSAVGVGV